MGRTNRWTWIALLLLAALTVGCGCDDDDDDDNDSAGGGTDDDSADDDAADDDDNDDATDQPPTVENTTDLADTPDEAGPYVVQTEATDDVGLTAVNLRYRVDGGDFVTVPMNAVGKGAYAGDIPGQAAGTSIEYYVAATDTADQETTDPADAQVGLYAFSIWAETLVAYDDGEPDNTWAAGGEGSYVFLRVTPPAYPAYLRDVWGWLAMLGIPGAAAEPVVVYDEDGLPDPPDIADAISLGDPFTPTEDAWNEIDVSAVPALATPLAAGDFYIGFRSATGTPAWGWDEDYAGDNRSWTYSVYSGSWHAASNPGVVMIRAVVATP